MRPVTRGFERGFTLVELLTTVAITGTLAALGTIMVRQHFAHAKTAEAIGIIEAIRQAQGARRAETGTYQNCSPLTGTRWYPATPDGTLHSWTVDTGHADYLSWQQLHVLQPEGTRFGFLVHAGTPGATLPTPATASKPTWPTPTEPWYVIQAAGDQDKDTKYTLVLATSFTSELYIENDGE